MLPSSEILIAEERIGRRIREMAREIAADSPDGSSLSVLALMDGAFMFCADLVRRLPMPVHTAFVPVRSVRRGGDPAGIRLPVEFPVRGADLLVVEDILDTGQTLRALLDHLSTLGPSRVRLAVLLDKPAHRKADIHADYVGFRVGDRWVVGFGLDSGGMYRNLPYITWIEDRSDGM
jgi:hypoxanthine phosphoribosyltransferase